MIYFIGNIEKNICKIGYSARPHRRIKNIESKLDYPIIIFDIIEGCMDDEKIIHALNDRARITGEWYHLDKVKSLDINGQVDTIIIDGIKLVRKHGYYHATSLINSIDKLRIKNNRHKFNFTNWMTSNNEFLDSFKSKQITPIKQGYAYWLHPYVVIEIMRAYSKTKLIAYENLNVIFDDPREAVRIGVNENIKQ